MTSAEQKAPSWLARRMQTTRSQRQELAGADCRLQNENCGDGGGPKESAADTFRPTHKRSKSLAAMDHFLIYNNELERASEAAAAARCDKTSASTIKKLINNNSNNKPHENQEENIERRRHEQENNGDKKKDAQFRCDHEEQYLFGDVNKGREINNFIKRRLTTTVDNKTSKLPLRFRLKWLLTKPLSSLSVIPCLLMMMMMMLSAGLESRGSFVINISEQQPPHHESISHQVGHAHPAASRHAHLDTNKHKHEHKHQVRFIIVSNATSSQRSKRASGHDNDQAGELRLERSAKLQEVDALNYLQRYGYMASSGGGGASTGGSNAINLISEDSFQEAVMQFQRFAGIPETGSVDSLTVRYMQMPRCGNKDMSGKGENGKRRRRRRRKKRYALQGSKWRRQELSYRISQYPTRFQSKKHEVDSQIERAFKIWSQVAPIDFVVKKDGRVHIDIRFASGEHGDGDPFDGPGNTLAHAYFPQYGGDAHFDDQEYWTVDSYAGTNIFQVAAHELGHSLGLGHSSVREALMAPFYQKFKPNFKLHADDVLAIQALYGERGGSNGAGSDNDDEDSPSSTSSTTSTTESAPPRRRPPVDDGDSDGGFFGGGSSKPVDLCQDSKIDAITRTEDGNTYVFRGHHYWQIKNEGLASGSPGKISRDWDGLPGNLDAALTWSDGKTFFFKGDKYWRYFNKRREPGYPKLISVGFAGIPNNIQTAFVWSGNGKTYFFKGDKYWRFDSKQEPPVSGQYPKPVKNWSGLPTSNIDAAFKWENGMTYFFKDELYYRFDDREFEVDSSARPAFPRSTAEWWFGCTNSNLPIRRASQTNSSPLKPANDIETSQSQSEPSLLLFHRRPNLSYEQTSDSTASNRHNSGGGSLSRSIFSSLSSLFPSSSSSSSSSSSLSSLSSSNNQFNSSANNEDWSFHRGLGEEVRRLMKGARAASSELDGVASSSGDGRSASRWFFPLGSNQSGNINNNNNNNKEQSLSELRMMTTSNSGDGGARRAGTDGNNN